MENSIYVSKIDAAKRELEFSIRLFFLSGDPVVLHLIVSSSQQLLRDLCRSKGKSTFLDEAMTHVKKDKRSYIQEKLHATYNFFHHADRDPDTVIEFSPEANEYALWESVDMYYTLAGETTGLMQAYRLWFYTKNSDLLVNSKDQNDFRKIAGEIDISNMKLFLDLATTFENQRIH